MKATNVSLYVIFFLSGIAGLGYEIVWTRMFAIGLGHEMPSVLAVVAAFFGGLALGAWGLDRAVSRSRAPGRWYAALEALIALWALVTMALIPALNRLSVGLVGLEPSPVRHWLVAFAVPFLALLPATAAMGATFPAMERLCSRLRRTGRTVAGLYAVNTTGAVAGTLLATFVIIPAVGYGRTILMLVVVNAICAFGIMAGPARGEQRREPVAFDLAGRPAGVRLGFVVFMTGLLGIGYEVLCVRVMGQVLENTVYSFASALSVYLVGTAIGAALYQRAAAKVSFAAPLAWLLQGLAVTCLLGVIVLQHASPIYEFARQRLGAGSGGSIAAEMLIALLVFLAPTMLMGATFSHLAQAAREARGGIGRALGLNTLGSSLAPLLFGVVLLPLVGARWALSVVALAYLLVLLPVGRIKARHLAPSLLVVPIFALLPARLVLVEAPQGTRIIDYREGVMAAVAVIEDAHRHRLLKVNDRFQMGGTGQSFADRRQAHLPLLLHPGPRRALFLGLGTGITAGAATHHPGLAVEGVELVPEVVDVVGRFAPANRLDRLGRDRCLVADARRYVRGVGQRYDVIVADLFHPARDGAGGLYTREHFEAVRSRLAAGGLFCQWLPLYQLDLEMVRLIARTFLEVFPDATVWIAHFNAQTPMLALVGGTGGTSYGADWYAKRVTDTALAAALDDVALGDGLALFGCLLAGNDGLRRLAGAGALNTDDRPEVVFRAPYFTYRKDEPPHRRLEAILDACAPSAAALLAGAAASDDRAFTDRLDGYLAARDIYLGGLIRLEQDRDQEGLALLLESLRASPDFRTAYITCLQMAADRAATDPESSRELLRSLIAARPDDPRAAEYLRQLGLE
ncbi:MAG: fused MFS/spermidine synthase [Planctomycetota bacterium]|jgi:spermidine synthase